jgi:VWFA-related protein
MYRPQSLSLLFSIVVVSMSMLAQQIGQQGTDPFTGRPANPVAPAAVPTVRDRVSRAADEEGRLVFRSQSVLVQVPAVVSDKSGNHVHNLTKDVFKVLENGKPQRIMTFEEVNAGSLRPQVATPPPGTFSNLALDGKQPFSATVIALDTINTPFLDQFYGRKQLIKYLAGTLDSGHVVGLVVIGSKGVRVLSGLTTDPGLLITALKKASGELSPTETFSTDGKVLAASDNQPSELTGGISPGADPGSKMREFILKADALEGSYQQARATEDTLRAFLAMAWSLAGVPGRKSLIWATSSFPFLLDSPSAAPGGNLSLLYERTVAALNDAQVAVYPVDVRGLVSTAPTADATYSGDLSGPEFGNAAASRSWLQTSSLTSLEVFAELTGGRAYYNTNDLATSFKRAADDSSSYYLLGYYLDSRDTKPGWRKLQVQVQGKDWDVRARTGVMVTNATLDPQLTHQADIDLALISPLDSTGIPVAIQWQQVVLEGDKRRVEFALRVPATSVIDEANQNRFDVDFIALADRKGTPAGKAGQTIKGSIPPATLPKIKAEGIFYKNALELPSGDYQLRFVVRDNLSGKIGSVSLPLRVN